MKRWHFLPVSLLSVLAACDETQELQGRTTGANQAVDASAQPSAPVVALSDAGTTAADAATKGPVSICVPKTSTGAMKLLVDGTENGDMEDVDEIAFTSSRVFVLSSPFAFVGAPYGGGVAESYSLSATLSSFTSFAIAPAGSSVLGSRTGQNVGGGETPSGHVFALKGTTANAAEHAGEIVLDGSDLIYWTKSPAQLVHASLAGKDERIVADYSDATGRQITAMAVDATDIWFTSVVAQSGGAVSGGKLNRAPRAGGAAVEVVDLPPSNETPDGIVFAGGSVYLPLSGAFSPDALMVRHVKGSASATLDSLTEKATRSSPVVSDGEYFYWAESNGGEGCPGVFKRRPVASYTEETLATNLDRVVRLRARNGTYFLGTAAEPFRTPATRGQLLVWTP